MRSATWHNFNVNPLNCGMNNNTSRQKFNIDKKIIILQAY